MCPPPPPHIQSCPLPPNLKVAPQSLHLGGVTASASYTFGFTFGISTTDSTGNAQTNSFIISPSETIPPHSAVEWQTVLSRQRVTVPYTATIIIKFWAELDWVSSAMAEDPTFTRIIGEATYGQLSSFHETILTMANI